jgi:hypothetical protein
MSESPKSWGAPGPIQKPPKPPKGDKDFIEVLLNHEEPTRHCLIRKSSVRKATQALSNNEITLTFLGETQGDKDCRFDMKWEEFVNKMKDTGRE